MSCSRYQGPTKPRRPPGNYLVDVVRSGEQLWPQLSYYGKVTPVTIQREFKLATFNDRLAAGSRTFHLAATSELEQKFYVYV